MFRASTRIVYSPSSSRNTSSGFAPKTIFQYRDETIGIS